MEEKYNAVVIRATNYRDNDKMLTLFTLENGLQSACLRGVKKVGAKLAFAGELFCFGEFVLIEKNGRKTVKEVNQIDSFYGIRLDTDKFFAGSAIAEFASRFLPIGIKSYDLFLSVISALKTLNESDVKPEILLITFYLNALEIQGYGIDFSHCTSCGKPIETRAFYSFSDGASYCADCASASCTEIRIATYKLLNLCFNQRQNLSELSGADIPYDKVSVVNALRLIDFALKQMVDVEIKSNRYWTE